MAQNYVDPDGSQYSRHQSVRFGTGSRGSVFCASRTASLTERRHKLGVRMGTWSFPH